MVKLYNFHHPDVRTIFCAGELQLKITFLFAKNSLSQFFLKRLPGLV